MYDQSERMPPSGRMQMFIRPKHEAKAPETAGERPWYCVKYPAAMLFIVSSTPEQK